MNARLALVIVSAITTAALCGQQKPAPTPAERAKALLDEASAAPVEIFAQIASSKLLPVLPPKEREEVLTRLFDRAGEARAPLPLQYAAQIAPPVLEGGSPL